MITIDVYIRLCAKTYGENLFLNEKSRMGNIKILSFLPGVAANMCIIAAGMIYEGEYR